MFWTLPKIALIDIDRLVYSVASVVEGTDEPDRNVLHSAKMMLDDLISEVTGVFPTIKAVKLYVSDNKNFRKFIRTEQKYKGNRPPKPEAYHLIRSYYQERRGALSKDFLEADDFTAMNHYAMYRDKSFRTVLVDNDKDLDQIPGWRIIPHLKRGGSVVRGTQVKLITKPMATRSFYTQILTGDKIDNIPGLDGIGPKKAEGILKDCVTEYDHWVQVWKKYSEHYDTMDEWDISAMLISRASLLYMKRFPEDSFIPPINMKKM